MATTVNAWNQYLGKRGSGYSAGAAISALEARLFDKQRAVYDDPSKFKALLTTRRAGKTDYFATDSLITMCQFGGENEWSGYVALTKGQARRNIDGPLRSLIREHNLPIEPGETDGQITFTHANGHRLWVGGVDDLRKVERWRGNKWRKFRIDEAGAWPDDVLEYMIDSAIEPGLSDTNGTLEIAGTPGVLARGYFFEVTEPGDRLADGTKKRPMWPTHRWSVRDNPHHRYGQPGGAAEQEAYRIRKGWGLDHPTWLREQCGLWASDPDLLIYHYDGRRNSFHEWPTSDFSDWFFVLGVDLGQRDETTFVLTCSQRGRPHVYVLSAWGASGMSQPARTQSILRIQDALKQKTSKEARVVVDTGGLGLALAEDLQRAGASNQGAKKAAKGAAIRAVQGALLTGTLLINPFSCEPTEALSLGAQQLLGEWSVLPWNDERTNHREGYADHCSDALVYAYREHPTYERWDEEPPVPGTAAAINAEAAKEREYREKRGALENRLRRANAEERMDIMDQIRALDGRD